MIFGARVPQHATACGKCMKMSWQKDAKGMENP